MVSTSSAEHISTYFGHFPIDFIPTMLAMQSDADIVVDIVDTLDVNLSLTSTDELADSVAAFRATQPTPESDANLLANHRKQVERWAFQHQDDLPQVLDLIGPTPLADLSEDQKRWARVILALRAVVRRAVVDQLAQDEGRSISVFAHRQLLQPTSDVAAIMQALPFLGEAVLNVHEGEPHLPTLTYVVIDFRAGDTFEACVDSGSIATPALRAAHWLTRAFNQHFDR